MPHSCKTVLTALCELEHRAVLEHSIRRRTAIAPPNRLSALLEVIDRCMASLQPHGRALRAGRAGDLALFRSQRRRPQAVAKGTFREASTPQQAPPRTVVETGLLGERRQAVVLVTAGAGEVSVAQADASAAASLDASAPTSSSSSHHSGGPLAALRAFFLPTGAPSLATFPSFCCHPMSASAM
jgi:hypothetical protein